MPKIELTHLQKEVLLFIGRNTFGRNFYWTGGTLLSYFYLSHRFSVDLDFFSENLFKNNEYLIFINELKKEIGADNITEIVRQNRRLYLIEKGKDNVKLEFVFFPFPAIEERKKIQEFSVKIDSLEDVMINKIHSTYERNEVKDIYDLYWYLINKPKYNFQKLISLVEKKIGVAIEPSLLIEKTYQLCDDINKLKPLLINNDKNISIKIKTFFQKEFNKLAKKKIK
ncbi:MAG: nucleotidyl transferase AbiEii/AbiGii toxin family protein [bacterium]|nr:nucleotidyl transferase AbiEii/AbiGii toxin family protein [bacterium]